MSLLSYLATLAWLFISASAQRLYYAGFPRIGQPLEGHVEILGVGEYGHVHGLLQFNQPSASGPVIITGDVFGLTPGLHGMHIHENGDITNDCKGAGPHFNPFNKQHGAPTDYERHVGDLGNIESYPGYPNRAHVYIIDNVISLAGPTDIINRALVIHANADDLGRGYSVDSLKTGNAGDRVACGIIVPHY